MNIHPHNTHLIIEKRCNVPIIWVDKYLHLLLNHNIAIFLTKLNRKYLNIYF